MLGQDTFVIALSFADQRFMSSPISGPVKEEMACTIPLSIQRTMVIFQLASTR